MFNKDELLNAYRHAKGLFLSVEKLARSERVIRCPVCREFHPLDWAHPPIEAVPPLIVEHKPGKK